MATDKQVLDLLARCQYKYKDLAKRDIQSTLSYFKELSLIVDKYVYPNGQAKDLLTLSGTIPVNYKNNRYNIPVQLYLSDSHPYTPPLCYVRPTPDMSVNVSDHVDSNGRINLPCLREWSYPQSDTYILLNLMTMKFSEQSPVFAKRQSSAYPANNNNNNNQNRPTYPSYTPYPSSSNQQPYPAQQPPYPISGSAYPGSASNTPYPVSTNPYYPMPQASQPQPSFLRGGSGNNIGNVRPASASNQQQSTPYPLTSQQSFGDTIKPEHLKLSLVTAVIEKASNRYFELASLKQAEIDSLRRVRSELQDNQTHLNNCVDEVENEILNMSNLTIELKEKTSDLNEKINQIQHRDSANIEDAVVIPAPLYRQIMQLYAEEISIQDYIFFLREGLQNNTIGLDLFLKQVRFLSRKQFMMRATMQKARLKAGLPL